MDSRVLEIVFFLMDSFEESDDQWSSVSEFSSELKNLGYTEEEISTAYTWVLEHMGTSGDNLYSAFPNKPGGSRILTDSERARLSTDAHGFMLKLLNLGLLNSEQFENILDRVESFGTRMITGEQVRLIASAVMSSEFGDLERGMLDDSEMDLTGQIN